MAWVLSDEIFMALKEIVYKISHLRIVSKDFFVIVFQP